MELNTEHCEVCNGKGYVPGKIRLSTYGAQKSVVEQKDYRYMLCPRCRGFGKVDWVRKITKSSNHYTPTEDEVTPQVRELVEEDKIYDAKFITMETSRRRILKEIEEDERKRGGMKKNYENQQ